VACFALGLAACGGGSGSAGSNATAQAPPSTPPASGIPVIEGLAPTTAVAGLPYDFRPEGYDPDGDTVTFSVTGLPHWASFDPSRGRITGTPSLSDIGSYPDITIAVTDGNHTVALPSFGIEVRQSETRLVQVAWSAPSARVDGSPLDGIASYTVRVVGAASGADDFDTTLVSATPDIELALDTGRRYLLAVTAIDLAGIAGPMSQPVYIDLR
jgi:hypothetical protein